MKTSLSRASLFAFVLATGLSGCFGGGNDSSSDCPIDVVNFTPASGRVGDLVTITGAELGGTDAIVGFSGAAATPMAGSTENTLVVAVPRGAQTAPITVDVPSRQNCQGTSGATSTATP